MGVATEVVAATVRFALVSVNTGRPAPLGFRRGEPVSSAIRKSPTTSDSLLLRSTNLEGDEQADLRVHGGPDKALYVYAAEHLAAWAHELGTREPGDGPFTPGSLGENLTVAGVTEADVCIGDRWRWGDALVEVAQPRQPCFKLAMRTARPEMTRLFEATGRTGWYLRVLEEGRVPTTGELRIEHRDVAALSVAAVQRLAGRDGGGVAALEHAAAHPALAQAWRNALLRRVEQQRRRSAAGAPAASG